MALSRFRLAISCHALVQVQKSGRLRLLALLTRLSRLNGRAQTFLTNRSLSDNCLASRPEEQQSKLPRLFCERGNLDRQIIQEFGGSRFAGSVPDISFRDPRRLPNCFPRVSIAC